MQTKRIFFVGVGGQGNILATKLVGEAAMASNVPVSISETHGMAQRGGVVESTAVIGAQSPIISDSEADVILAFEPLEALRSLHKAHAESVVITSLSAIQPFTVAIGQGSYPDEKTILNYIESKVKTLIAFDALVEAKAAGNPKGVNMVMLGALMAGGDIPLSQASLKQAIETKTKKAFLSTNLDCFQRGFQLVAGG